MVHDERRRRIEDAARRALEEAQARRASSARRETDAATEVGGVDGPEPTRFGDWEKAGRAYDF